MICPKCGTETVAPHDDIVQCADALIEHYNPGNLLINGLHCCINCRRPVELCSCYGGPYGFADPSNVSNG